jgi:hydrogenase expression/formation protein HypC
MCLAIPVQVQQTEETRHRAMVAHLGVSCWVGTSLVGQVEIGDYVLVHAGEAICTLERAEALKTLEVWEALNDG